MEASRKIGGEEGPDTERTNEVGAVGEGTGVASAGEENVDKVGEKNRPEDRNGAEKEEDAEEEGDAKGMCEDDHRLKTALQRNGERRKMNTDSIH